MSYDDCKCRPKDGYYLRICKIHGVLAEGQGHMNDDATYNRSNLSNEDYAKIGMWSSYDDGQGRRDNMG